MSLCRAEKESGMPHSAAMKTKWNTSIKTFAKMPKNGLLFKSVKPEDI